MFSLKEVCFTGLFVGCVTTQRVCYVFDLHFLSVAKCRGSWVVGRAWVVGVGVGRGQKNRFPIKKIKLKN